MNANDVMTEGPVSIRANASVREAMTLLQSLEIRHLPVVDAKGNLVGMLSDRDLGALALPNFLQDPGMASLEGRLETPVSYIMNAAVFWVRPDTDVSEIVELMTDQKIGAVPVLSADGALVGIVTYVDLLREFVPLAAAG